MIDDTINFELLEDWAINYLGQKHKSENLENKTKGQKVKSEFKKLGAKIVQDFPEFLLAKCTDWQNSGYIYQYLWMQFKHKEYKNNPSSISIFIVKDTNKNAAKLLIETEIDEKNAKKSDYEAFSRALDKSTSFDNSWYWEDNNETIFYTAMAAINSLHERTSKKVKIVKHIKGPYSNTESKRIINELKAAFKQLIPCYKNIYKYNEQIHEYNIDNKSLKFEQPKNQILYGPPGTGKTYNTVIKAMEIINGEKYDFVDNEQYKDLKKQFDNLKQQGQIEFVTFHQSYSYEEFVEGIKPDISKWNDDGSELKYVGKDGIFKNICEHAKPIKVSSIKHQPIDFSNTKVFKMSLGNTLEKEDDIYEYCISNDVVALGFKDVDFSDCKTSQDFKDKDDSWGATALERFINWMDVGDIIIISNGNKNFRAIAQVTGNYYYDRTTPIRYSHFRKVEWLYKGEDIYYSKINNKVFSQQSIYGYFDPSKKGMPNYNPDLNTQELNNIITGKVNKEIALPHILIIDEINRGNISKIFGELITLIEEDKRGTLSVKLPYSQEDFTVPQNLYIIGTMNTSDRSIASIDIALRRRFKFVEMMPRPELVADFGCSFQYIFEKLNTKIKILLDRDHQIGHSYFINTKYANADTNILKEIWFSEIIPLLNEYFYCDWEKLKLVIPGFIKEINIPEELKNECEDSMYEFKTPNEIKDFVGALKQDKFKQEN